MTLTSLADLRCSIFSKKKDPPKIKSLPPTDDAAVQHVRHARLQVLIWRAADQAALEVCMGMGLTGIPWVPWDSHGNGNHSDSIMGVGMGMGIKAWKWELNNGNGNGFPLYLFSTKSTLSSCTQANVQQFWLDKLMLTKLYAVARKVLCVPASSAASKRVFSTAGRLLEKRRTSLAQSSVNSLLFLHTNIQ